jgi:hypothetical protein
MPIIHWQSHGHQPVIMLPSLIRLVVPSDPVSAEAPLAPERQVTQTAPHNPALASGHPSHPALLAGCTVTQRATTMLPQMTGSLECSCCFLSRPLSALASGCPLEFSDSDMHVRALILHEFCLPYNNIPTPRAQTIQCSLPYQASQRIQTILKQQKRWCYSVRARLDLLRSTITPLWTSIRAILSV